MFHPQTITLKTNEAFEVKPPFDAVDYRPGCSLLIKYETTGTNQVLLGGPIAQSYPLNAGQDFPVNEMDPGEWPWLLSPGVDQDVLLLWQGLPPGTVDENGDFVPANEGGLG